MRPMCPGAKSALRSVRRRMETTSNRCFIGQSRECGCQRRGGVVPGPGPPPDVHAAAGDDGFGGVRGESVFLACFGEHTLRAVGQLYWRVFFGEKGPRRAGK